MLNHNLVLKSDELYLVGDSNTDGSGERATGLYVRDTRHLSMFEVRLNGQPLDRLGARAIGPASANVTEGNHTLTLDGDGGDGGGSDAAIVVPPLTVGVQQHIELSDALRVEFRLRNFGGRPLPLVLELELGADFRDLFDIRGFPRRPAARGRILDPEVGPSRVGLAYEATDGARSRTTVAFARAATEIAVTRPERSRAVETAVLLPGLDQVILRPALQPVPTAVARFAVVVEPHGEWRLTAVVTPDPADAVPVSSQATLRHGRPPRSARVTTDNGFFDRFVARCGLDLLTLQTSFPQGSLPAAGIPWYVAPFGRDSLIAGLQLFHTDGDRAAGILRVLAAMQGARHDPDRDEAPGKILHESRYGEMARLGEIPHTPYFGTVDATPLFVLLFAETVAWSGDDALYRDLLPNVRRALDWMAGDGDPDGDALIEYHARQSAGAHIIHQGWKDSHDSLHHADGRPAMGSIALVEVQGYAFAAYHRLAEVVDARGEADWATALRTRAEAVRRRVEDAFWIEAEGCYAQALDGDKTPVQAISSNAGHLLFCGLPSAGRGTATAERLSRPDMDSGWGVRTLSAAARSYNPMSYHNGSVWPHDNSLIAAGMRAYGRDDLALRIASALFAVAETDPLSRLPELYCGFQRAEGADADAPVAYPVSCSPQAWAAGAGELLTRVMLGLQVDVAAQRLLVNPALPPWLNRVTVDALPVLGTAVTLDVRRDGAGYAVSADGPVTLAKGSTTGDR